MSNRPRTVVRKLALAALAALLPACSHFSEADARWVATEAETIGDVVGRLGEPEETRYNKGTQIETAIYRDLGMHGVDALITSFVLMPLIVVEAPIEMSCGGLHRRALEIRYDTASGRILDARSVSP